MSKETVTIFESSLDNIEDKKISDDKVASLNDVTDYDINNQKSNNININTYNTFITLRIDNDSINLSNLKLIHETLFNYINNLSYNIFDNTDPSFILTDISLYNDEPKLLTSLSYPFNTKELDSSNDYIYSDFTIRFHKFRKQSYKNFPKFMFNLITSLSNFFIKTNITYNSITIGQSNQDFNNSTSLKVKLSYGELLSEENLQHIYACAVLDRTYYFNTLEYHIPEFRQSLNNTPQLNKHYNTFANKAFKSAPQIASNSYDIILTPINQWFNKNSIRLYDKTGFITVKLSIKEPDYVSIHDISECIFHSIIKNIPPSIIRYKLQTIYVLLDKSITLDNDTMIKSYNISSEWELNFYGKPTFMHQSKTQVILETIDENIDDVPLTYNPQNNIGYLKGYPYYYTQESLDNYLIY